MSSSSSSSSLQRNVKAQALIATGEAVWAVMEFIFGHAILRNTVVQGLLMSEGTKDLTLQQTLFVNFFTNAVIMFVASWRLGSMLGISAVEMLKRLQFFNPFIVLSKWSFICLCCHTIGLGVMAAMQHLSGRWLFGWDNYYVAAAKNTTAISDTTTAATTAMGLTTAAQLTETIDWVQLLEIFALAPIREELLFRGILFVIIYRRIGGLSTDSKKATLLVCAAVFGMIHLLNFFGSRYPPPYISLQIALGSMIGLFYSVRFLGSGTIWEPIWLHVFNNVCSSFLPLSTNMDVTDPLIGVPRMFPLLPLRPYHYIVDLCG